MTPVYRFFHDWLGPRWAWIATAVVYALTMLAIIMTLGSGANDPILYLNQ